jgi:hypothetical protein
MTREAFLPKKFHPATLAVIEHANEIIAEYERGGFSLTLRQLYYQFVARRLRTPFPNTSASAKL